MVATLARTHKRPIFYCNAVGGNDQLVFDGNSIAVNAKGQLIAQLPAFREHEQIVDSNAAESIEFHEQAAPEELFHALSLGVKDYLRKCGFKSAVLGLSGGIDSAVVAAVTVVVAHARSVIGLSPAKVTGSKVWRAPKALQTNGLSNVSTIRRTHSNLPYAYVHQRREFAIDFLSARFAAVRFP